MTKAKNDTIFLGHPSGLGWLSASEFWERFSYYGMAGLLVLYMTHQLLNPEHVANIWGFPLFERFIASLYGPGSGQTLASHITGFYQMSVYVTPLAGGYLADRYLGKTAAVTTGALMMALGHFLMAFDASFVLALLFLLVGVGLFKGNIAAQVGDLYSESDPRRADGFQIYYIGIQLAVIISPFICGTLGETVGWHWGFGAAGIGMLLGLLIYLTGLVRGAPDRARQEGCRHADRADTGAGPVDGRQPGDLQRLSGMGGEEFPDRVLRQDHAHHLDAVTGRHHFHSPDDPVGAVLALVCQAPPRAG
jgi:POT family proton-dependent oligopeptide transporter